MMQVNEFITGKILSAKVKCLLIVKALGHQLKPCRIMYPWKVLYIGMACYVCTCTIVLCICFTKTKCGGHCSDMPTNHLVCVSVIVRLTLTYFTDGTVSSVCYEMFHSGWRVTQGYKLLFIYEDKCVPSFLCIV